MLDSISTHFIRFVRAFSISAFFLLPIICAAQDAKKDSLLAALQAEKTDAQRAEIYNSLSQRTVSSNTKQALDYAQQASFYAKKSEDHNQLIAAYKNIAYIFSVSGVLDQAANYLNLCIEEAKTARDEVELVKGQLNLGLVYIGLEDYQKAVKIYEKGDSLLTSTYQKTGQQVPLTDQITVYLNLGACYVSLGDFVKGYQQLDKGLELAASNPTLEDLKVKLWVAKANALVKENKTAEAYSLLKQAESTLLQQKNRPVLMVVEALLAGMEEQKSNYQKAIEIYRQLYQTAMELDNVKMKKEFSQSLYKNYERLQQSDSAIKYLNLFTGHEKEANSIQAKETLFRKELLQEFSEREKKLIATNSNRMRYLMAGASVFLIILLGWLLFFRRKYRQADLQKLKLQLEAERRDLEQRQLQAQVAHQERQLSALEYQLSKNAMLGNLVTELQSLAVEEKAPKREEAKTIERVKESHQSKIWDEFEIRFLKTHAGFFDRLMSAYPGLTVNERRLCAFLRLDMTTKEISVITGQSIRAIEIARTRLRKKLNLTETEKTLFEHLSSI